MICSLCIACVQVEDHVRSLETQLDELERNEKTLDSKIEKKKQELERNEKRLSTLQSVRPAYMDEYERLQGELNDLYGKVRGNAHSKISNAGDTSQYRFPSIPINKD